MAYERLHPKRLRGQKHAKLMRVRRLAGEMMMSDDIDMVPPSHYPVPPEGPEKLIVESSIFHEQKELRWFKRESLNIQPAKRYEDTQIALSMIVKPTTMRRSFWIGALSRLSHTLMGFSHHYRE